MLQMNRHTPSGRQDVLAEIAVAGFVHPVQRLQQHVGVEDVVAHRGQRVGPAARHRPCIFRLFPELGDAVLAVDVDDAELAALAQLDRLRSKRESAGLGSGLQPRRMQAYRPSTQAQSLCQTADKVTTRQSFEYERVVPTIQFNERVNQ